MNEFIGLAPTSYRARCFIFAMDLAVTQALTGLLPGTHGDLPSELLELANALHAQSRSQASSLKGDEEIARSYACAHLACNR